jgi:nitroreductase
VDTLDVFEAIKTRKSIRAYNSKQIPQDVLLKIMETAQLAPSAGNIQPWHFIVVTNKDKREKLAKARFAKFFSESPVVIVGCGNQRASPKWYMVDVTIALEHIVLAATSEGLGTCWVGSFNEYQVKEILKVPGNYRIVALLALGYPREKIDLTRGFVHLVRKRKKLDRIISYEEFGKHTL